MADLVGDFSCRACPVTKAAGPLQYCTDFRREKKLHSLFDAIGSMNSPVRQLPLQSAPSGLAFAGAGQNLTLRQVCFRPCLRICDRTRHPAVCGGLQRVPDR